MDIYSRHMRRWGLYGDTDGDVSINDATEIFNDMIDNKTVATVHDVDYTTFENCDITNLKQDRMSVSDVTRNDKDSYDTKLAHFKLSSEVKSGSYIRWANDWWLVSNEETNSVFSHKTFIIKKCSIMINYKYKDVIYNIPTSIVSLTMYSDGLKENVDITTLDGKRSILFSNNDITKTMGILTRVMVNKKSVFKITHMDDFTNENIITSTIQQVQFIPLDDIENNVAYNECSKSEIKIPPTEIQGEDTIFLGDTLEYTHENNVIWSLSDNSYVSIISNDSNKCVIECSTGNNAVNKTFDLIATLEDENIINKTITIRGFF